MTTDVPATDDHGANAAEGSKPSSPIPDVANLQSTTADGPPAVPATAESSPSNVNSRSDADKNTTASAGAPSPCESPVEPAAPASTGQAGASGETAEHAKDGAAQSKLPPEDQQPAGASHARQHADQPRKHAAYQRRPLHVPDDEAVVAALTRLAVGVIKGEIDPKAAAVAGHILRDIRRLGKTPRHGAAARNRPDIDALREAALDQPGLLSIVEPLLSDAELESLLGGTDPDDLRGEDKPPAEGNDDPFLGDQK
jgi:hypothetical protein